MPSLRVHALTLSLDGYVAGPRQRLEEPLGDGGSQLHQWMLATKTMRERLGQAGGNEGPDDRAVLNGEVNIGATIMGRNMFGPQRGPWTDESWTGWWGETPPYRHDVFVMTHHLRPTLKMAGGTTFHFLDEPPEKVLGRAYAAAHGQDVKLGGGAATIRQFLSARLIDQLDLVLVPVLLGSGERLLGALDLSSYAASAPVSTELATHVRLTRTG